LKWGKREGKKKGEGKGKGGKVVNGREKRTDRRLGKGGGKLKIIGRKRSEKIAVGSVN